MFALYLSLAYWEHLELESLGPVARIRGQPRRTEEADVHSFRLGSTEY